MYDDFGWSDLALLQIFLSSSRLTRAHSHGHIGPLEPQLGTGILSLVPLSVG